MVRYIKKSKIHEKKIPCEFDIPFKELSEKMHEIFRLKGDGVKVRFRGETDTATGDTTLLFYGSATT